MRKYLSIILSTLLVFSGFGLNLVPAAYAQSGATLPQPSRSAGKFFAASYAKWTAHTTTNTAAAASTVVLDTGLPTSQGSSDARFLNPFQGSFLIGGGGFVPILIDSGTPQETVTPTGTTSCGQNVAGCTVTGTFNNAHGAGALVTSGTMGLQEAINDAAVTGGVVVIDPAWTALGGTNAMLTAAAVAPLVSIEDDRGGPTRFWSPTATGVAFAAPTTLTAQAACDATHQACSDATVVGSASWGGSVFACVTYVDVMGNEGPCSATATWTSVASKAIDIQAPAATAGAVGWVPYLSLSGGTYALAYQIPVTATVCTMTAIETTTPACALTNTKFGQTASTFGALSTGLFTTGGAQITTFPVNTAMLYPDLSTTAQTLAAQHPGTNSSITYSYVPSSRVGACPGASSSNIVYLNSVSAIAGSSATTVTNPIATWTIPSGCFNYIGAEFRVTGKFTYTDGGDSSTRVIVSWDANGTNTASVPTPLCNMLDTATGTGAAYNGTYTCTVRILTTGASGTALVNGYSTQNLAAGATTLVRNSADVAVAASAAIALNTNARIMIVFEGVGATNNPGAQGLEATLEYVN